MSVHIPSQRAVLAKYGPDHQAMVHAEELAELIQAVSKMRRRRYARMDDSDVRENLLEEMADVLVCLKQMQLMYSITEQELQAMIDRKCARQEARLRDTG